MTVSTSTLYVCAHDLKLTDSHKTFSRLEKKKVLLSLKWDFCCHTDAIKSNKILIFVIILILNFPLLELRAAMVSNECDNPIISISQFNQAAVSHDYLIII